jgi:hypothetical protein
MIQVDAPYQDAFKWIFDSSVKFETWLRGQLPRWSSELSSESIFWIQGKSGSGKSTLMKYALNHPKTAQRLWSTVPEPWILIPFFFYDRGSTVQRTVNGLLEEILLQLLKHYLEMLKYIV